MTSCSTVDDQQLCSSESSDSVSSVIHVIAGDRHYFRSTVVAATDQAANDVCADGGNLEHQSPRTLHMKSQPGRQSEIILFIIKPTFY